MKGGVLGQSLKNVGIRIHTFVCQSKSEISEYTGIYDQNKKYVLSFTTVLGISKSRENMKYVKKKVHLSKLNKQWTVE